MGRVGAGRPASSVVVQPGLKGRAFGRGLREGFKGGLKGRD